MKTERLSRFKEFYEVGWLLLESLLVESDSVSWAEFTQFKRDVEAGFEMLLDDSMNNIITCIKFSTAHSTDAMGVSLSLKCFILHDPQSYYLGLMDSWFGT